MNYIIDSITHKNGELRTDGRYPLRIGRRGILLRATIGRSAEIQYCPREGEEYEGYLLTSMVENILRHNENIILYTMNSIYYLKLEQ